MNGSSQQREEDEATPLLPRAAPTQDDEDKSRRCLRLRVHELCLVVTLIVGLAVFAACYWRRRPGRQSTEGWKKITVQFGESTPHMVQLAAKEITDKPLNDLRKYQHATLPNGLQVLNVQDLSSLKAAFAVAVRAGSFDDPLELPGLAHFCEHMLFLGTKKYPEPSGFDDFMAKSGGQDNAYTSTEVTVYYGEVSQASKDEVLDRFADFFRAPLFDRRFVKKEVHAIDSEHAKNVQSPMHRIMQALNSLADPASPVGRFHTGNVETLYERPRAAGLDPVDGLQVYFKNHYCPEQMRLVTYGSSPVHDQLLQTAKLFGSLSRGSANCSAKRKSFAHPEPWPRERLGKWVLAEGTQPQAQLWLHFPLPDVSVAYLSQPLEYLDYVMGYQGESSLARVLQDTLGLASSAQFLYDTASSGTSVYFVATLTKTGREHLESVLDVLYAYIATLRNRGVNKELYESIADVMKLKWDWAEPSGPSDTASDLAERMTRLPLDHLLSGDARIDRPNPELVQSLVKRFTPENMNVAYVDINATSRDFKTLPYYGVHYSVQELSGVLPGAAARWSAWLELKQSDELRKHLSQQLRSAGLQVQPAPTPFSEPPRPIADVPKHIPLEHMRARRPSSHVPVDEELFGPRPVHLPLDLSLLQPSVLLRGAKLAADVQAPSDPEVWYRSGWVTESPKVTIQLDMRPLRAPNEPDASALEAVRLGLYSRMLGAEIAPKMADLTATGVSYDISVSPHGLSFSFGGFAPVLPRLVDTVLTEFNRFNANSSLTAPQRFERLAQELREELSSYTEMPVQYAVQERSLLLSRGRHSNEESLTALNVVSLESAASSARELLLSRPLHLSALAMGNIDEQEAQRAVAKVWGGLRRQDWLATGELERVARVVNPRGPVEVRSSNPRPDDPNDAVVVSLLWGPSTIESRVTLGLLGQILSVLAYNELRTSRQLGYIVSAGSSMVSNVQYISALVQGNVLKADDVEAAIELVLMELMPRRLQELSAEELGSYLDSFQQELLQPPLAPSEEVSQFWGPVRQGGQCFELRSEILRYLNSSQLTRQRLAEVWAELATPTTGVRKKLSVKYFAGTVPPPVSPEQANATWQAQGLSPASIELLLREKQEAQLLRKADSAAREQLIEQSGFFSQELSCYWQEPRTA